MKTLKHYGGISFLMSLTLVLLALKLTNIIALSWVWVLSPVWAPILLGLTFVLIAGIIGIITHYTSKK